MADELNRYALSEYAAMLYFWRHPHCAREDWIGFTSYRQMEKVRFVFEHAHLKQLRYCDILTWRWLDVGNVAAHAEESHPGITAAVLRTLGHFGLRLPCDWHSSQAGVFANYWAVRMDTFNAYMSTTEEPANLLRINELAAYGTSNGR